MIPADQLAALMMTSPFCRLPVWGAVSSVVMEALVSPEAAEDPTAAGSGAIGAGEPALDTAAARAPGAAVSGVGRQSRGGTGRAEGRPEGGLTPSG